MKEQIEEMARDMVDSDNKEATDALSLFFVKVAEHLCNAGYRKQSVGEWIKKYDKAPRYVCSACNHLFNNKEYKYCPNCGAHMKGGAE